MLDTRKLKQLREAKGWDQAQAAERCGLGNKARWNDIETGRRGNITLLTLDRIAKAFGVEACELLRK